MSDFFQHKLWRTENFCLKGLIINAWNISCPKTCFNACQLFLFTAYKKFVASPRFITCKWHVTLTSQTKSTSLKLCYFMLILHLKFFSLSSHLKKQHYYVLNWYHAQDISPKCFEKRNSTYRQSYWNGNAWKC